MTCSGPAAFIVSGELNRDVTGVFPYKAAQGAGSFPRHSQSRRELKEYPPDDAQAGFR